MGYMKSSRRNSVREINIIRNKIYGLHCFGHSRQNVGSINSQPCFQMVTIQKRLAEVKTDTLPVDDDSSKDLSL